MDMNRRAMFGATVAVAALAAPAVTVAQPSADAELHRLIDHLIDVRAKMEATDDVWWSAVQKFDKAKGEEPEALKKRHPADWSAGLPVFDTSGGYFDADDLPACREALARNEKLLKDSNGFFNVRSRDRCLEVIEAIEARDAYLTALRRDLGVTVASERLEALIEQEEEVVAAVQACRPNTVEGLKRKADLMGSWEIGDSLSSYETAWARALLADVMALKLA